MRFDCRITLSTVFVVVGFWSSPAFACFSCSSGSCDGNPTRTDCYVVYSNGQASCRLAGDWCAGGGGGRYPDRALPTSESRRVTAIYVVARTPAAKALPLDGTRDVVLERRDAGESVEAILGRSSGLAPTAFRVVSAAFRFGNSAASPTLEIGKSARFAVSVGPTDRGLEFEIRESEDDWSRVETTGLRGAISHRLVVDGVQHALVVESWIVRDDEDLKSARLAFARQLESTRNVPGLRFQGGPDGTRRSWGNLKLLYR